MAYNFSFYRFFFVSLELLCEFLAPKVVFMQVEKPDELKTKNDVSAASYAKSPKKMDGGISRQLIWSDFPLSTLSGFATIFLHFIISFYISRLYGGTVCSDFFFRHSKCVKWSSCVWTRVVKKTAAWHASVNILFLIVNKHRNSVK